ncbi:MAG: bifunctional DNA primase/polymerase [Solirubrobacteraceae bacterium]
MTGTAAMALARRGLAVFPVDPLSKAPKTAHGCKDATRSEAVILDLWRRHPAAGVGVATGKPSGIVAIDVDPCSGGEDGFADLAGRLGAPGRTVQVVTPRGGWHLWFKAPAASVSCSAGKLAPGVDIRGDGGYVVAPPTTRPDGTGWRWAGGAPLAGLQPEWIEALTAVTDRVEPPTAKPASTWTAMLSGGIPEGRRDADMCSLAGHLFARRGLDAYLVVNLLRSINQTACRPPLPSDELERIIDDIAASEARRRGGAR